MADRLTSPNEWFVKELRPYEAYRSNVNAVPGISPFRPPRPCHTSYLNCSTRLPHPNSNFETPTLALAGAGPPYGEMISDSRAGFPFPKGLVTGTYNYIVLLCFMLPGL